MTYESKHNIVNIMFLVTVACAVVIGAMLGWYIAQSDVPHEPPDMRDWLRIDKVFVYDAEEGSDHLLEVDRSILKGFSGVWVAEITKENGSFLCSATWQANYEVDDKLPPVIYLFDWWMKTPKNGGDPGCDMVVGCYYLNTRWSFATKFSEILSVAKRSNKFCVKPKTGVVK